MSTRPYLSPESVITNGDMSGNITSSVTILQQKTVFSYGFSWSGTVPVGTLSLQFSNDYSLNAAGAVKNAGTWTTATFSVSGVPASSIAVSGSPGTAFIDVTKTGAYAMRTVYTRTSGTGTLQCLLTAKVS